MAGSERYIHGTVVVIGERGVLIRGASGSGKSRLATLMVGEAQRRGLFAALVGDDRVELKLRGGRLVAQGHPSIAGLVERRGEGVVAMQHEAACVIHCLIDLPTTSTTRMPGTEAGFTDLLGAQVFRIEETAGLPFLDVGRLVDRILHPPVLEV